MPNQANVVRLHATLFGVVLANDENAGVTPLRFHDQVVQFLEIVVIPRQKGAALTKRLLKVNRIISAGQANLGWRPNIMSRLPQRLD
jgi:hypothetical protein